MNTKISCERPRSVPWYRLAKSLQYIVISNKHRHITISITEVNNYFSPDLRPPPAPRRPRHRQHKHDPRQLVQEFHATTIPPTAYFGKLFHSPLSQNHPSSRASPTWLWHHEWHLWHIGTQNRSSPSSAPSLPRLWWTQIMPSPFMPHLRHDLPSTQRSIWTLYVTLDGMTTQPTLRQYRPNLPAPQSSADG